MEVLVGTISAKEVEMGFGLIKIPKLSLVYFKEDTEFLNTSFQALVVGQRVKIVTKETPLGPLAIQLWPYPKRSKTSEISPNM